MNIQKSYTLSYRQRLFFLCIAGAMRAAMVRQSVWCPDKAIMRRSTIFAVFYATAKEWQVCRVDVSVECCAPPKFCGSCRLCFSPATTRTERVDYHNANDIHLSRYEVTWIISRKYSFVEPTQALYWTFIFFVDPTFLFNVGWTSRYNSWKLRAWLAKIIIEVCGCLIFGLSLQILELERDHFSYLNQLLKLLHIVYNYMLLACSTTM